MKRKKIKDKSNIYRIIILFIIYVLTLPIFSPLISLVIASSDSDAAELLSATYTLVEDGDEDIDGVIM